MNPPLHPVLVHLPLGLAVMMPLISGGMLLAWWKDWFSARTWAIVVALQLALVAGGFAALQSGEKDEDAVESIVPKAAIEAHEQAAQVFVWTAVGTLLLATGALVIPGRRLKQGLALASVAGTLAVLGAGYVTGKRGGELVYTHNAGAAYSTPAAPAAGGKARHEHD